MPERRRSAPTAKLDIKQISLAAQGRWLFPDEICKILQNYKKFHIASEPPNKPKSGSLFLFNRQVLRYFRKDGHDWRKNKDSKKVKEAHEKLKVGGFDVLNCYYAYGEENEKFQRRSYWLLKEELCHIVLVHYQEGKETRRKSIRIRKANGIPASRENKEDISNSKVDSSAASIFQTYQRASPLTDTTKLISTQASEHEDAESAYMHKASARFQSIHEFQAPPMQKMDVGSIPHHPVPISNNYEGESLAIPGMSFQSITQGDENKNPVDNGLTFELQRDLEFPSWENIVESSSAGYQNVNFELSLPSTQLSPMRMMPGQDNELLDQVFTGAFRKEEFGSHSDGLEEWKASDRDSLHVSKWSMDQTSDGNLPLLYDLTTKLNDVNQVQLCGSMGLHNTPLTHQRRQPMQNVLQLQDLDALGSSLKPVPDVNSNIEDKTNYPALRLVDGEGLKKDSFDHWMSKELGDVTEWAMQPGSGAYWETVGSEDGDGSGIFGQVPLGSYILGPSLSQDQLFSINDFYPNCAHSGSEIKVLVTGRFLGSREEVESYKWACMFGELEVPAQIVGDGVLQCHTPSHESGRVPFYVTCSNRLACNQVREFEFRSSAVEDVDTDETRLHMRFGKLLSLGSGTPQASAQSIEAEISPLLTKVNMLLKDDTEWEEMLNLTQQDEFSADKGKDRLLQKLLKEKLHNWLLWKIVEGGKGPNVLDEDGQGVLHFAAALGYDWAIPPTIAAGDSVNFRDANGWTALHWSAHYGRERTVAFLISLGAAPGALTDPTPKYPSGRTPADLAASNGHKGIAGYLAESALSSHLLNLNLKGSEESDGREKVVETVSERVATPVGAGDFPHGLSLKDSLAAVRNATQAAARIHQVYRMQSFQRKQLKEYGDSEFGISDERALSLLALKTRKAGQHDGPAHAAAIRIQNKFRSWKGRKNFLLIRQQIIKIQAHVRGHQVRKNYKKKIWSVGILDKIILRWRRKGRGLSGFRPEALAGTSMLDTETKEDDYDFLKEGRKQTEERLQKALARVKSMVQYPEARDQYCRLLNAVSEMPAKEAAQDVIMNNPEVDFDEEPIGFEALLEDDTPTCHPHVKS